MPANWTKNHVARPDQDPIQKLFEQLFYSLTYIEIFQKMRQANQQFLLRPID